jgi:hypothetical protein
MNAAAITMLATLGSAAVWAQQPSVTLSPAALKEIAEVEAEIDRIEAQTLKRLAAPPNNEVQQVATAVSAKPSRHSPAAPGTTSWVSSTMRL